MSTGLTSTDRPRRSGAEADDRDGPVRQLDARWWWWGGAFAALLATIAAGSILGPGMAVLVLAGAAFIGAVASGWDSIRALLGELPLTGEDAFALGAPSVEEEQKRAVLRAIKDLEFERGVGKISEEDYALLMRRYRRQAKRLLQLLDDRAAPERARAETLVNRYLEREGLDPMAELEDEDEDEDEDELENDNDNEHEKEIDDEHEHEHEHEHEKEIDDEHEHEKEIDDERDDGPDAAVDAALAPGQRCQSCRTDNDDDATFCKRCGAKLSAAQEQPT